ncbi:ATP-binding protein [Burkholderia sp. Ac-20379]|uniref:ATP-binding protein n=1 Tax=Burkholderia sp. Ac-20379 TaxID=2703900 RepID=UPI00197D9C1C|nr:ATP-binding protein [Burkholderia sp. Ac-20379]MBN3727024.1 CHASE2 domain-containing protein [Burkholderia sp. Ac-20379]
MPRWLTHLRNAAPIRHWRSSLLAASMLVLAALAATPTAESIFAPIDRLLDDLVAKRTRDRLHREIAVVAVDQRTLAELGPGPSFSRTVHAQLLDRLSSASAVVVDFMLSDSRPDDAVLARAMRKQGRVVLPTLAASDMRHGPGSQLPPAPALASAAAATGPRSFVIGADHQVYGIVPFIPDGPHGEPRTHVVLEALRVAGLPPAVGDLHPYLQDHVSTMGRIVPDSLALAFPPRFDLDQYSYVDVLKGRVSPSELAGRIVFVGDITADMSGDFNLSSMSRPLRRVQIDALVAEALLDGQVLKRTPQAVQLVICLATALGMLAICLFVPSWRMYGCALAWIALYVGITTLLLLYRHYWVPIGPTVQVCAIIFAVYGWRRVNRIRGFLLGEFHSLSERSAGSPLVGQPAAGTPTIQHAIRQIRAWQTTYVDVIQSLPYPVFLERDGRLILRNERGTTMLAALDPRPDGAARDAAILALARDEIVQAHATGKIRSVEMTLEQRHHLMMVTPFDDAAGTASMICFVDVHALKEAVTSDRQTLRHMAHDLRNPLSSILALVEAHGHAASAADPAFLADLQRLVNYSLRVSQDFMQLSRAEHLDPKAGAPLSLNDLAAEAVDQVWHAATAKRMVLNGPHHDGPDVFVLGNSDMLLRALVNLLDNAIKYSAPGTSVDVWIDADNDNAAVRIEDHGVGIEHTALQRLFEPFFQVGNDAKDASQGVGLGLPFVKAVIERHGGTIDVQSTPGAGSRFTVRLKRIAIDIAEE